MKRINIFISAFAALCALSCTDSSYIGQKDMAKIMTELYMVDQYVDLDPQLSELSGTQLVYAPYIRKYGYTIEQFTASLEYYRRNPDKFVNVLASVNATLGDKMAELMDSEIQEENVPAEEQDQELQFEPEEKKGRARAIEKAAGKRMRQALREEASEEQTDSDISSIEERPAIDVENELVSEPKEDKSKVREKRVSKENLEQLKNKWE